VELDALQKVLDTADQLYSMAEIEQTLERLASELTEKYSELNPLLLCVMTGSVMTAGHLIPKLHFPLELDYIHASRYANKTTGGVLHWHHQPITALSGREVLLIEDIFDEGITVETLRAYCLKQGAKSVTCVALVNKIHQTKRGTLPEFIGLSVPDRYVFGFGMDYQGYWRNASGIYAVKDENA